MHYLCNEGSISKTKSKLINVHKDWIIKVIPHPCFWAMEFEACNL